MMGKEAQALLVTLSQLMSSKIDEPILNVKGQVNGRIAIAVARLYSRVLRGSRVPSTMRTREPDWELGLRLGLAQ